MIGLMIAASNLPPWMTGPNVIYVGIYGYGSADYEERVMTIYSFKSSYVTKGLSSASSHFGGGGFVRWNTWGVSVDFQEGYFYAWKPSFAETTYTDTSFFQDIAVTLAHYRNPYSWTYIGFTVASRRFAFGYGIPFPDTSSGAVKNSEPLPVPNSDVRYLSMGISGKFYLELENLYSEGRGFLPWAGGRVGWAQVSFESRDPLGYASGTGNTLCFSASLGLDFYASPWLSFFVESRYAAMKANVLLAGLNPGYKEYYDQVRVGYNNASIKAGVRFTWYKERY